MTTGMLVGLRLGCAHGTTFNMCLWGACVERVCETAFGVSLWDCLRIALVRLCLWN